MTEDGYQRTDGRKENISCRPMEYGKIYRNILVILLIAILAFLSLYEVYLQEGSIGRVWDWGGMGEFPKSHEDSLRNSFYAWHDKHYGGMESWMNVGILYNFYYYMLSLVTPYLFSKILVTMLLFLTGINFYFFLKSIKVNEVLSFIFALIYMFNTRIYSMIILGHLTMILFFTFFPLVVLQVIKFAKTKKIKHLIISTIIIALTNVIVPNIILMFSIVVFLAIIFIKGTEKGNTAVKYMLSCCIFILLSSYFLLPFVSAISKSDYFVHVGFSLDEEAELRFKSIQGNSWSFDEIFSFYNNNGLHIETANLFWGKPALEYFWRFAILSSFALIFFYYFMKRKRRLKQFEIFLLTILFVVLFLISGVTTFFGKIFYMFFFQNFSMIYSAFSTLWRYSPLLIFSWCVLFCLSINHFWERVKGKRTKYMVQLCLMFFLAIYLYPWFIHSFTERVGTGLTGQPIKLKVNKLYEGDKRVYHYLWNEMEDYRVMFLPPPRVMWPVDTKYGFCWNSWFFKKNMFFESYNKAGLYNAGISALYTRSVDSNFNKMLGLGNVKYLIRPYYESNYFSFVDDFCNHEVDYKKIEKNNLMELLKLNKIILNPIFSEEYGIDIFRNTDYLPHIYSAKSLYFVK